MSKNVGVVNAYETRVCVFLDFLGFKDHLDRADADPKYIARISRAIALVREHMPAQVDGLTSRQFSQYSDCVTVSYKVEELSGAWSLLLDLLFLQIELVGRGFLVRGGVTVGHLVHDELQMFGPAQVRAHHIESREAIFPRILVDEGVIDAGVHYRATHHDEDDERGYLKAIVQEDFDGKQFIAYTSFESVVETAGADASAYPQYMDALLEILEKGLRANDPCVVAKALWLYWKYVSAREEILPQFRDNYAPDSARSLAVTALATVRAHVSLNPKDAAKCTLPSELEQLLSAA